ncbi:MAG TPA: hypothetical protein VMF11_12015 [Candidatus Baltobacteraceae bacterium]|nr:hypothetical protein [Candidatus Baltobacteraceae bacterium]
MSKNRLRFGLAAVLAIAVPVTFVACGGGGGGSTPPAPAASSAPTATPLPTPTPTPPGASSSTIETSQGSVSGQTGMFTPSQGDTSTGGQGSPVDGITCDPTMSNNYHIHVYLGIYVNGQQAALPIAIGMENPGPPDDGFIDTATCFYHIHTHDSSGIVHVEDPDPNNIPITGTMYTVQNILDVWGITADSNHFGPFTGPVRVFTSGQVYRGDSNNGLVPATDLTFYGTNPVTVPLYSHEVIDVEIGPTWPTTLPNVSFYLEY